MHRYLYDTDTCTGNTTTLIRERNWALGLGIHKLLKLSIVQMGRDTNYVAASTSYFVHSNEYVGRRTSPRIDECKNIFEQLTLGRLVYIFKWILLLFEIELHPLIFMEEMFNEF